MCINSSQITAFLLGPLHAPASERKEVIRYRASKNVSDNQSTHQRILHFCDKCTNLAAWFLQFWCIPTSKIGRYIDRPSQVTNSGLVTTNNGQKCRHTRATGKLPSAYVVEGLYARFIVTKDDHLNNGHTEQCMVTNGHTEQCMVQNVLMLRQWTVPLFRRVTRWPGVFITLH